MCTSVLFLFLLFNSTCYAKDALTSGGILNDVLKKYQESSAKWEDTLINVASYIFFSLATISMVWTFAQLLFQRSSLTDFFGELIRFIMFTGFYLWLLQNGSEIAMAIIDSFQILGGKASQTTIATPSSIVDIGFSIFNKACESISLVSFVTDLSVFLYALVAVIILVILALVGINMMLQYCSAWVLAYAGIIFLGFGGSRWTSDMAVNYFKTVLGLGASLMTMILLVGIGADIISEYHDKMAAQANLQELAVMLVASLTLFLLVDKLPAMVAGIITGASIGQSTGVGSFGAGAAIGSSMTAAGFAKSSLAFAGSPLKGAAVMAGGAINSAVGGQVANNARSLIENSSFPRPGGK